MIRGRNAQQFHDLVEGEAERARGTAYADLLDVVGSLRALPDPTPDPAFDPLRVYTIEDWAKLSGISRRSAEYLIARGEGPRIVRLTKHRRGIRACDLARWQPARLMPRARKRSTAATASL